LQCAHPHTPARGRWYVHAVEGTQRPLELILARNLLASLSTPAFLVDGEGMIAFYNESAGVLLGRRYEDTGPLAVDVWTSTHGPFDEDGNPFEFDQLELTEALRGNRPAHSRFCIRSVDGASRTIEASGIPIVGAGGYRGAMVVFWPEEKGGG
jgi:PAS domain-containing protein